MWTQVGLVEKHAFSILYFLGARISEAFRWECKLCPSYIHLLRLGNSPNLGRILFFGYVACSFLPVRIAFPTLAAMLLHPLHGFPPDFLVEVYRDSLTLVDAATI